MGRNSRNNGDGGYEERNSARKRLNHPILTREEEIEKDFRKVDNFSQKQIKDKVKEVSENPEGINICIMI